MAVGNECRSYRHFVRVLFRVIGLSHLVRSILYWENRVKIIRRYRFCKSDNLGYFYFYLLPSIKHPGLADRLKAIISCYYIAKSNGYRFKIVFESPFQLKDYFTPNIIDWEASEEELSFSIQDTKILDYKGGYKHLVPNRHYICFNYCGTIIRDIDDEEFRSLFSELFKPSESLSHFINSLSHSQQDYVAIHLRFVNALGMFENGKSPLSETAQKELVNRCKEGILKICKDNNLPVAVFSDSSLFLDEISNLPVIVFDHDNIGHIVNNASHDVIMKSFVDFMLLSRAKKIYRIIASEMYPTNYSYIAAIIGNVPFYNYSV